MLPILTKKPEVPHILPIRKNFSGVSSPIDSFLDFEKFEGSHDILYSINKNTRHENVNFLIYSEYT